MKTEFKIKKAYQVPGGPASPDILKLPCVKGAFFSTANGYMEYKCVIYENTDTMFDKIVYARETDFILLLDNGDYTVLSAEEFYDLPSNAFL